MLLKFGGIVTEGRGSVGGVTFSRNRSGAYARKRTKPVDPSSPAQNDQRTRLSSGVTQWRALDEGERRAFNAKALTTPFTNRLGEQFNPSGMNLFMRGAQLLQAAGLAPVTVPPVNASIDDGHCFTSYAVDPGLVINSTLSEWPENAVLLAWRQIDLSPSIYSYKGPYSKASVITSGNFGGDTYTLVEDASLQADSVQMCSWRLVGADGSASARRYRRTRKPPAA